jgi:hypothetical protein
MLVNEKKTERERPKVSLENDLREECLRLVNDQVEEVSCKYHQNIVSLVDEVIMVVLVKLIIAIVIMNVCVDKVV